jgi:DNA-binding MarR family transcriptional regulator
MMEKQSGNFLRELLGVLIRNLGMLEKSEASCCGATIAQCHAIVEIGRGNQLSLNELAELLGLDKSTMSRTINNLVEDDLVIREIHPEDRRYITIELTDKGKEVFKTIENSMELYYQSIFKSIPEDKREQVIESLQLLAEAVKQNKCC